MLKTNFKFKGLSLLLAILMVFSCFSITAMAAPASDIPSEMLDNAYLDALEYTGYDVQAQKDDGSIFKKYGSSVSASIRSNISYGTGPSGLETVTSSATSSGKAPNISTFEANGLCCASYVSYVYYNYLPNVAGIDTSSVPCPSNPRAAAAYDTTADSWVNSGKARRISFTQNSDGSNFVPSEDIPIGSLIVFKHIPTGKIAHVAIYAGYYNGQYLITHVGDEKGPEFGSIVGMSKGGYPEAVVQVVVPEFVESYGAIEIQKNDTDGTGLAGAYFSATSTENSSLQYLIGPTNSSGYAISNERIPYGQYKVKETVFPTNYRSYGQTEWTVTVSSANNGKVKVTAVNELIPGSIKIVKTSEDNKVSGVSFKIEGNGVNKTVITANNGEIQTDGLKPGTYKVSEITEDKYEPQSIKNVTVVSGGTATVTFNNVLKRGDLTITKNAEDGLVEGLEFQLTGTSLSGHNVNEYAVTDSSGKAYFTDVLIGTGYTIKELNIPERYVVPEDQTTDILWNEVTQKTFENKLKKFRIDAFKVDLLLEYPDWDDGPIPMDMALSLESDEIVEEIGFPYGYAQGNATLEGAVYGVYKDDVLLDTYTTDKNGYFVTKYYPYGWDYYIKEITPSEGYLLDEEYYYLYCPPFYYDEEFNTEYMTVYEQIIRGTIRIAKHSDNGHSGMETPEVGAEFQVYLKSAGSYENAKETERETLIIDETGIVETKKLPYGVYTVVQTKGLEGKEMMPPFDVNITEEEKAYGYIINNATFKSFVEIVKKDIETGKVIPSAGIGFKVRNTDTGEFVVQKINYPTPTSIEVYYTDDTGKLMMPYALEYGNYEIIEQNTAYGYVLDKTPVAFKVDGSKDIVTVVKSNIAQKGTITINKSGEVFSSVSEKDGIYIPNYEEKGLEGAVFGVYAVEDIYTPDGTLRYSKDQKVATLTTSADGSVKSEPIYLGKYKVIEEKAPYGTVLNTEPIFTELAYAGEEIEVTSSVVSAVNQRQKVAINLLKQLEQDGKFGIGMNEEYKNIKFALYVAETLTAADGTQIPKDGLLDIIGIDENGLGVFAADIPVGAKLYVKEYTTDNHYLISDTVYPVEFTYGGEKIAVVQLNVNNGEAIENVIIRGTVEGIKTDDADNPIEGVIFGLFKADETEFKTETALLTAQTDKDGKFTFESIPFGKWLIKELSCPKEYVMSEETFEIDITEQDAVISIKAINKFIAGKVQIKKVNSENHEQKLSGAEFEIYLDVNNNKIFDFGIDTLLGKLSEVETGIYELDKLKYGGYFIYEAKAPEGFNKDDRYFYFGITTDKETVEVKNEADVGFINEPIPLPEVPHSPQTGDNSNIRLWALISCISLGVLLISSASLIKSKQKS